MKSPKKNLPPFKATRTFIFVLVFLATLVAADIYFIASKKYSGEKSEGSSSSSVKKNNR